jgi:hypothetical protein
MSKSLPPATGRPYGIERVYRLSGYPRSFFYAQGSSPRRYWQKFDSELGKITREPA